MAPEVTSTTWWPWARTAAASAHTLAMAASSTVPSSAVMEEVPILATTITASSLPAGAPRLPLRCRGGRRQTSHVRVTSSGEVLPVRPSEVFVVERPGAEAAVEDSDEPVADHTERAGVCVTGGSSLVVEGSGAG